MTFFDQNAPTMDDYKGGLCGKVGPKQQLEINRDKYTELFNI